MKLLLDGKCIIVTGGAGLIGKRFCRSIVEYGGIVVVADRNFDLAEQVASDLNNIFPKKAFSTFLDISNKQSIDEMLKVLNIRFKGIDAIVNNAYPRNSNYGRKMENVTYEDFCENINLHLGGYFLVMQRAAVFFGEQGHGNIINMSSIYGSKAPRFSVYEGSEMTMPIEYAAIKSGIENLTRYFSQYLKGKNIRVNSLSPGGVLDNQPEEFISAYNSLCSSKGMLDPEDLTGTLVYLLSDLSKYLVGQNLIVDDGFSQ